MDEPKKEEGTQLTPLCAQCDEYLAGWKRCKADYDNALKEMAREKAAFGKYANEQLMAELLPAIDQFALAMKHVPMTETLPEASRGIWEKWLVGVRAVRSAWDQAAKQQGLERIPTDGMFDPLVHEAAGEEDREGAETGLILSVLQDGWRLYGKVLRPARVIIAK